MGLMVFQEVPGWGYIGDVAWQDLVVRDLQQMIVRDRNHPSIVLWGVRLNETPLHHCTLSRSIWQQPDDSRNTTGAIVRGDYHPT